MTDSTARAERFERESPASPSFTWMVPQKPVAVRISLEVIEKLEKEAVETYRSLTSRGSEIGGLLFGSVAPGHPAIVAVDSYETFPCDYASGPLYHLSSAELARLDRVIEERRAAGKRPVGFFRSQTRKTLALDSDDLALLDSRFSGAHDIALLVRPSATKASTAGIFIREDGKIRSESSYLEFPFRSANHQETSQPAEEGTVAGPKTVPAAPAAPIAPKPVVRAQIVPIASRREVMPASAPAEPVAEPVLEAEPAALPPAPAAAAATPPAPAAPKPAAPAPEAAAAPAPKATESTPAKPAPEKPAATAKPAAEKPTPAAKPAPAAEKPAAAKAAAAAVAPPEPKRSGKLVWILAGIAATAVLAGGLVFTSGMLHLRKGSLPANTPESGLALRIERNAGDILLTWNREAEVIKHASRAVLAIHDGSQNENVVMDLSQLRTGSIVYSPMTSDVVFQMEVTAEGQSHPVAETVRVLSTRPSPMPDQTANAAAPAPAAATRTSSAAPAPAETPGDGGSANAKEEKVALAQPLKPFHAESLAQRLRPTRPEEVPDAPAVSATPMPKVSDVNLGGIVATPAAPPPVPAPAAATPAAASVSAPKAADKKPTPGGKIQQAQLVRRKDPEYPKIARESGVSGVVELIATVGTDGRVHAVKVVRGHPLLLQAATDAVKQWIYRPTLLNGQPVETETQILLNFKPER